MENNNNLRQIAGEEEIDLIQLVVSVFRRKFLVAGFFIVFCLAAFSYLQVAVPIYEADVSIMVTPISDSSALTDLLTSGTPSTKIQTEVELLSSRRTIEDALGSLDLTKYVNAEGIRYSDFEKPLTAQSIENSISVSPVKDTNIVKITVQNPSPEFCADFANALAESYNTLLTNIAKDSASSSLAFVESQIPINEEEVHKASQALADFQKENSIMQVTEEGQTALATYSYLKSRRAPLELEIREADTLLADLDVKFDIARALADPKVSSALSDYRAAQNEILKYDLITVSLSAGGRTGNNVMTQSQSARYYTLSQSATEAERAISLRIVELSGVDVTKATSFSRAMAQKITAESEIELIEEEMVRASETLEKMPDIERKLAELQSEVTVYETMEVSLLQMLHEAKLLNASVVDNVTEIDKALIPEKPVSPRKLLIMAAAGLMGLLCGALLAILLEFSDRSISSVEDLKKILPEDVPFLGWIPLMKVQGKAKQRYRGSIVHKDPSSYESERYKLLASNFMFGSENRSRVVSVCSTTKGEGKTSIMANVAVSLTQNGYSVLLVDGDLRLPSCEQYFDLKAAKQGLVDVVLEKAELDDVLVYPIDDLESLMLLPCGTRPPIPSMIYYHENFRKILEELRSRFDIILIDAPPLEFGSELMSLSKVTSETLIVARAGIASADVLSDVIERFQNAGTKIAGVCLNGLIPNSSVSLYNNYGYGYGYGYGKGYGYGYGYDKKKKKGSDLIVRRVSIFTSRKAYYRKRYKLDNRLRTVKNRGNLRVPRRYRESVAPLTPEGK
ncbi:MAG: polysaccharide biosynthesis tyrosine autokinase [Spirochaetales bacterium]|nr:polysaccharide biosynthesis tyrosine autokinase [Spirochaetales bacterium]